MARLNKEVSLPAWQEFLARHQIGDVVEGTVSSVVSFGAFVEVAAGVDGLLHESVWGTQPDLGSTLRVQIADVDVERRRISLAVA